MHRHELGALLLVAATACSPSAAPASTSEAQPSPSEGDAASQSATSRSDGEGGTPASPDENTAGTPAPSADPAGRATGAPAAASVKVTPAEGRELELGTVPVFAVEPVDVTVTWRDVYTASQPPEFVPVEAGVLARASTEYFTVGEDGTFVAKDYSPPDGDALVMGVYPDNLWYVRVVSKGPLPNDRSGAEERELSWMRLRGGTRWVPQDYSGAQRFADVGQDARVGHRGGLVVRSDRTIDRVAGGDDVPRGGECPDVMLDFVETRGGTIYSVCQEPEGVFARGECDDETCTTQRAVRLPHGRGWSFSLQVARQRHSVTLAGGFSEGDATRPHLLHYETGGWKLEPMPGDVRGLWATKDGGLWITVGDTLLHRDPDGGWRRVALPAGLTGVSVAISKDLRELYVAGAVGSEGKVFATGAFAQKPDEPAPDPEATP